MLDKAGAHLDRGISNGEFESDAVHVAWSLGRQTRERPMNLFHQVSKNRCFLERCVTYEEDV